ncbi:MAG TPA: alpha/beta fold hydrolase, partial [Phycisphaerales bacterium]|nr:alpha/beta fold hydrolase [Phycisphaerales bacterium]
MTATARNKHRLLIALLLYAGLLLASRFVQTSTRTAPDTPPPDAPGLFLRMPETKSDGPLDRKITLHLLRWGEDNHPGRPPVILLHGSPGAASNFDRLAPRLAQTGRVVFAPDLPGFGLSTRRVADYAIRAHARAVLEMMDALGIERAHVVGWSMGGGVAFSLADLAPDRLASITLLAAVGAQETEGSGNYYFEHIKYAVGLLFTDAIDLAIPHFGSLDLSAARAFLRNFWDSDQRPLKDVMTRTTLPVLILHGSRDPLVSVRAARRHHELIPTSRLVITPYSHFMPFLQPDETTEILGEFFDRHDTPGTPPETGIIDRSPPPPAGLLARALDAAARTPWWAVILIFALLARLRPETATALAGVCVASMSVDFGVASVGLLIGRAMRPPEPWQRRGVGYSIAMILWTLVSLGVAQLLARPVLPGNHPGFFLVWIVLCAITLNTIRLIPTHIGRRRIIANIKQFTHL